MNSYLNWSRWHSLANKGVTFSYAVGFGWTAHLPLANIGDLSTLLTSAGVTQWGGGGSSIKEAYQQIKI